MPRRFQSEADRPGALHVQPAAVIADYAAGPQPIGLFFAASQRRAKFHIEVGARRDRFLDRLARYPKTPARLAKPYGVKGWVIED